MKVDKRPSSEEWWRAHYEERIISCFRREGQFTRSGLLRELGNDCDRQLLDQVLQGFIKNGIIRESGRRLFAQNLPDEPKAAPSVSQQTRAHFEALSDREKTAIAAAGDIRKQVSSAAEKRLQRRIGRRRLPSLGGPCQ